MDYEVQAFTPSICIIFGVKLAVTVSCLIWEQDVSLGYCGLLPGPTEPSGQGPGPSP